MFDHFGFLIGIFLVFATLAVTVSGYVGPKRWRDATRKLNKFNDEQVAVLFPVDPYKPIIPALRGGWSVFVSRVRALAGPGPHRVRRIVIIAILGLFAFWAVIAGH